MSIGAIPYQLPNDAGWQLTQSTRDTLVTPEASSGVAQTALPQVPAGETWRVTRIAVSCTVGGVSFSCYYNSINPSAIADATESGASDVADEDQPIVLNEADVLLLVWDGCPDGAIGSASVSRDVYRRVT